MLGVLARRPPAEVVSSASLGGGGLGVSPTAAASNKPKGSAASPGIPTWYETRSAMVDSIKETIGIANALQTELAKIIQEAPSLLPTFLTDEAVVGCSEELAKSAEAAQAYLDSKSIGGCKDTLSISFELN